MSRLNLERKKKLFDMTNTSLKSMPRGESLRDFENISSDLLALDWIVFVYLLSSFYLIVNIAP